MKALIISFSLVAIHLELATSQTMARQQQNIRINRHVPEAIAESPRTLSPCQFKDFIKDYKIPKTVPAPSTTIVTDCTPSVCKNLANTLQLMIVCNLLQNQKGGPEVALQLASPFLNEVISSPSSCGCANAFANQISSPMLPTAFVNQMSSPVVASPFANQMSSPIVPSPFANQIPSPAVSTSYPNVIGQQIVTGFSHNPGNPCANSGLLSLLGLFNS